MTSQKAKIILCPEKLIESSGNIEHIPSFIESKIGDLTCQHCNSKGNFQFFINSDIISFHGIFDKNKGWRITKPKFGPLKIKEIKCLSCQKLVLTNE